MALLGSVVLTKIVNPGTRRTDAALQLSSAEPDPGLFRVPDGWKIVDGVIGGPMALSASAVGTTTAGYQYTVRIQPPSRSDFIVRDAPYSAEQVFSQVTNLAVPPVPSSNTPTRLYRDPYGRTRVERPLLQVPGDKESAPVFPEITDPIDDFRITLDPVHHIAHRFAVPETATYPPVHTASGGSHPNSVYSTRDLGEKTIEGVMAEGTLDTYRTPAGANGNDHELTETYESWFSPQLQMIILTKQDIATSKSTMAVTSIKLGEPDPALFDIPQGYTVIDEKAAVTITVTQP